MFIIHSPKTRIPHCLQAVHDEHARFSQDQLQVYTVGVGQHLGEKKLGNQVYDAQKLVFLFFPFFILTKFLYFSDPVL